MSKYKRWWYVLEAKHPANTEYYMVLAENNPHEGGKEEAEKKWRKYHPFPNVEVKLSTFGAKENAEMLRVGDEFTMPLSNNDELLEALEQYADPENWGYYDQSGCPKGYGEYTEACFIGPEVARQAIAKAKGG